MKKNLILIMVAAAGLSLTAAGLPPNYGEPDFKAQVNTTSAAQTFRYAEGRPGADAKPCELKAVQSTEAFAVRTNTPGIKKSGKVVTGSLVAKDHTVRNAWSSASMTLYSTDTPGAYELSGLYDLPNKINLTIDEAAGTVSIPVQVVYTHSTYGDVTLCPMKFTYNEDGSIKSIRYSTTGNVTGTIDASGKIILDGWGLIFTSNDKYKDQGFIFCQNSEWIPAPLKLTANALKPGVEPVEHSMLIEQTGPSSVRIFHLAGVNCDVLEGRLMPDNSILISPHELYSNLIYGPFMLYAATVDSTGKVTVNTTGNIKAVKKSDTEIDFGTIVIAGRDAPNAYVGYLYTDVKATGNAGITFPSITTNLEGEGTPEKPYLISTPDHFQQIALLVDGGNSLSGKYFSLTKDLDFSSVLAESYMPIGNPAVKFEGIFDGGNHTISNLKISGMGANSVGLFGCIGSKGVVKNLKLVKPDVRNSGENTGTIAGFNYGTIDNCHITDGNVISDKGFYIGGIAGSVNEINLGVSGAPDWQPATVSNCSYSGNIAGIGTMGGITGRGRGTFRNCQIKAAVHCEGVYSPQGVYGHFVAGLIGSVSYSKIENCFVSGMVQDNYGYAFTGGITARAMDTEITNSYNSAAIYAKRADMSDQGDRYVGGIAGYVHNCKIINCFNSGNILRNEGCTNVGGLVGYLAVTFVSQTAKPTVMEDISEIRNCLNYGQVLTPNASPYKGLYGTAFEIGGWQGTHTDEATFHNCYFDGQIHYYSDAKYGRKTDFFLSGAIEGFAADVWSIKKGQYPVLKQFENEPSSQLAASPLLLKPNDTAKKVKFNFSTAAVGTGTTWKVSAEDGGYADENNYLTKSGNDFTVKDKYGDALVICLGPDSWTLKMYRLSVVPRVFDGEGTAEAPFKLNTVADWQKLSDAVGVSLQDHEGDFFTMDNDVDFKLDESFTGVASGTPLKGSFAGSLDAKGHSIHKFKINKVQYDETGKALHNTPTHFALFGIIAPTGVVKNLNIASDCEFLHYSYGATLAAYNYGLIENCSNYAPVRSVYSGLGGLVAVNNGIITKCYNCGKIECGMKTAGGIAAEMGAGEITLCQNDGDVIAKSINSITGIAITSAAGGIVGMSYGKVKSCLNNGQIYARNTVGGIVAENNGARYNGIVENCINNGFVECVDMSNLRGGIAGYSRNNAKESGNIYDCSINVNGSSNNNEVIGEFPLSTQELTSGKVPEGFVAENFDFVAGSYPSLALFKDREAGKALRKMYVHFAPKQIRTNLRTEVALSAGTTFKMAKGSNYSIADGKLKFTAPQEIVVCLDTISTTDGVYGKYLPLSAIPQVIEGEGTAEAPYLIKTPADWNKLADFMFDSKWEYPGDHFRIDADLDFNGDSIRAIAVNGVKFLGKLDGNGKSIKNYVYHNANLSANGLKGPNLYIGKNIGVIGYLGTGGELKNCTFEGSFTAYQQSAGIVGDNSGVISNVTQKGIVNNTSGGSMAGIVYRSNPGSRIENCQLIGTVNTAGTNAAGIVYEIGTDAEVINCHNRGSVISGTSGAYGIAYTNDGMIKNCTNEGVLGSKGSTYGNAAGIVYQLKANGSLESCHNLKTIDYGSKGGNIAGIFYTSTSLSTGTVKNCTNTVDIIGKDNVYAICNEVKAQLKLYDCYNTGTIMGMAGMASGLAGVVGEAKATEDNPTLLKNCYNTGFISGKKTKTVGLCTDLKKDALMEDCYNFGDIISDGHTGSNQGGLCGSVSQGTVNRCFNVGKVSSSGYNVGGISGNITTSETGAIKFGTIKNTFNLGDVYSGYQGNAIYGNAGGIVGYMSSGKTIIMNTFNAGNVTSKRQVGGIAGGMLKVDAEVINCYNSGKVTATVPEAASDGNQWLLWSGTIFTQKSAANDGTSYFANSRNVYYDVTVNPGKQFRNFPNSAKTTEELRKIDLGEEFAHNDGNSYPVLKGISEKIGDDDISGSMLLLDAADNFEAVTKGFTLYAPVGAVWAVSDPSVISLKDNTATLLGEGPVTLSVTSPNGKLSKRFVLNLKPSQSGIDDPAAGKEVVSVTYFDLSGKILSAPVSGQACIIRTIFADGTMDVRKFIGRE